MCEHSKLIPTSLYVAGMQAEKSFYYARQVPNCQRPECLLQVTIYLFQSIRKNQAAHCCVVRMIYSLLMRLGECVMNGRFLSGYNNMLHSDRLQDTSEDGLWRLKRSSVCNCVRRNIC